MIDSRTSAHEAVKGLSREQAVELACRWAELALPVWETAYPDDDHLRRAIESARSFTAGDALAASHWDHAAAIDAINAPRAADDPDDVIPSGSYIAARAAYAANAAAKYAADATGFNDDVIEEGVQAADFAAQATDWLAVDLIYRQYRAELFGVPSELLDAWRNGEPMADEVIGDWLKERDMPPID